MATAKYFDGKSAVERSVEVRMENGALVIAGDGVDLTWPIASVEAHRRLDDWRVVSSSDPDARLIVPRSAELDPRLKRLAPRSIRGWFMLGATLMAASAFVALLIFVIMPIAAEPLTRRTPAHVEDQFGENLQAQFLLVLRPCADTFDADIALDPLLSDLEFASGLPFDIKLTFVQTPIPNALTLPGGRVLVTSGLLDTLQAPDEFAAVLAHELGHVYARDSMVSLYRNAGLGVFLEAITGGSGLAQQLVLWGGQLADLRYTRAQEERADLFAHDIMARAGYDPSALARAFEAIGGRAEDIRRGGTELKVPEWLLTHPDLDRRIDAARAAARPAQQLALDDDAWRTVRAACAR